MAPRTINITAKMSNLEYRALMWRLASVPHGAATAIYTALNKVVAYGRTHVAEAVAKEMTARITSVKKRITVRKASSHRLYAAIDLHGEHGVSLIGFRARQTKAGVNATIFGKRQAFPHAFIARGLNDQRQVFKREGEKRIMKAGHYKGRRKQPLVVLKGPTVPEVFDETPDLADGILAELDDRFRTQLDSQVQWLLKRQQDQQAEAA